MDKAPTPRTLLRRATWLFLATLGLAAIVIALLWADVAHQAMTGCDQPLPGATGPVTCTQVNWTFDTPWHRLIVPLLAHYGVCLALVWAWSVVRRLRGR